MPQISARVTDVLIRKLDRAARILGRSRAELVCDALDRYLRDLSDLNHGLEALQDPADPLLEWADVRRELLGES